MDGLGWVFLGAVGAYTCGFSLMLAGGLHLSNPGELREALAAHRLLPTRLCRIVMLTLPPLELALGLAVAISQLLSLELLTALTGSASGVLFIVFALYAQALVRLRPSSPCGCGGRDEPASTWTVVRALVLALFSATAVVPSLQLAEEHLSGLLRCGELLVAVTLAGITWQLPAALSRVQARSPSTQSNPLSSLVGGGGR